MENFEQALEQVEHDFVEVGPWIQELIAIKDTNDLIKVKQSAQLSVYCAKVLVSQMEDVIDGEIVIKHSDLTTKIEELIDKDKEKYESKFGVHSTFVDLAYAPIVQSGGKYD